MNVLYRVTCKEDDSSSTNNIFTITRQENDSKEERVSVTNNLEAAIYSAQESSLLLDKCSDDITLKIDVEYMVGKAHKSHDK